MLGITIAYQIREKLCALSKKCTAQTQKKKNCLAITRQHVAHKAPKNM